MTFEVSEPLQLKQLCAAFHDCRDELFERKVVYCQDERSVLNQRYAPDTSSYKCVALISYPVSNSFSAVLLQIPFLNTSRFMMPRLLLIQTL